MKSIFDEGSEYILYKLRDIYASRGTLGPLAEALRSLGAWDRSRTKTPKLSLRETRRFKSPSEQKNYCLYSMMGVSERR